jgi:uncharacterized protein DUF4258
MPERLFTLTSHAETVLRERGIELTWVDRVLRNPQVTQADRAEVSLRHALGQISERDDRVLRVIYNPSQRPWSVVTAYFDRRQRGKI